jgi:hypothetical protein
MSANSFQKGGHDNDLIDALEKAGAAPTVKNIAAVREYVEGIPVEMTATGWRVIEEAIQRPGISDPR